MKKRHKSKPGKPRGHKAGAGSSGHARASVEHAAAKSVDPRRLMSGRSARPQVVVTTAYEADDRQAIALLLLPFLILALFLGLSQSLKPVGDLIEAARDRVAEVARVAPPVPASVPGTIVLPQVALPSAVPGALQAPERIALTSPLALPERAPAIPAPPILRVPTPEIALPFEAPVVPLPRADVAVLVPAPPISLPSSAPAIPAPPAPASSAIVIATPAIAMPAAAPPIAMPAPDVCLPAPKRVAMTTPPAAEEFGARLAAAAQAQTADFVVYSASYRRIAYPMGDVPSMYGACSDLVIRAYRALGIDLQELVQRSRLGRGDPNIDHRRTETLRAFFAKYGQSIAPTQFPEDYKPGDIVTYYRPYSRVSRAHIAIVTDIIGPSGRPLIVHNRGWGPQIEDALFVDRITGQYRFTGAAQPMPAAARLASGDAPAARRNAPQAMAGRGDPAIVGGPVSKIR